MKAKSALFPVLMVLSLIVCLVASPRHSYAGTPEGTVCFQDNFGFSWFLDFGSYLSGLNFDVHGFLSHPAVSCNGTSIQPVTGTATFDANNTVVLGVWSIANGTGTDCESISWYAVVDLFTFQSISGSFMTQSGATGDFSLTEIPCSTFFASPATQR